MNKIIQNNSKKNVLEQGIGNYPLSVNFIDKQSVNDKIPLDLASYENKFWFEDDKNEIVISISDLFIHLKSLNIDLVNVDGQRHFVTTDGKILMQGSIKLITKALVNTYTSHSSYNQIKKETKHILKDILNKKISNQYVREIFVDLKIDTISSTFLFYKNNWLEITADYVKGYSYDELDGYIWENQIRDEEIDLAPYHYESAISESFWVNQFASDCKKMPFETYCIVLGHQLNDSPFPLENLKLDVSQKHLEKAFGKRTFGGLKCFNKKLDLRHFKKYKDVEPYVDIPFEGSKEELVFENFTIQCISLFHNKVKELQSGQIRVRRVINEEVDIDYANGLIFIPRNFEIDATIVTKMLRDFSFGVEDDTWTDHHYMVEQVSKYCKHIAATLTYKKENDRLFLTINQTSDNNTVLFLYHK